jgi:hypothetical protein
MEQTEIPLEVRRFISSSIPSIPHLEALMLLRTTAPERWSADSLAPRLYVSRAKAGQVLADLAQAGMLVFAEENAEFYYHESEEALIEQLSALHSTRLVELTLLVHSRRDR